MSRRYLGQSRADQRAFTLIELMVAMVGGMFVSIAVFTLAKHSSAFSLRQARIADATMQSVVGFERLKADLARAGFLSTPNLRQDPIVCGNPLDPSYPAWLGRLASVFIEPIPELELSPEAIQNGLAPNRLVLSGSYASPDQFVARAIIDGVSPQVFLVPNSLGMANIGYHDDPSPENLERVFGAGRALRIVDDAGGVQFGTIKAVTGGDNPTISLTAEPPLQFRSGSAAQCGVRGHGKNLVNVVNIVNYDIRDLNDKTTYPGFVHMFRGGPSYEATRRELIREELDVDGTPIPGTLELIAEYAVDLGFSIMVADGVANSLSRQDGEDVAKYAGDPTGLPAGKGPQLIRAVHAWLSVRSQEADRTTDLSLVTTAPGPNLLRISVNPENGALPPFARVRTVQSMIPLNNQTRATW
jgi:prepilin-type N-terminal cleavage/methylation domain-containing protein